MTLSAPMAAALEKSTVPLTHCLQWDLPDRTLRLSEFSPFSLSVDAVLGGFEPEDDLFGVLGAVGPISDGVTSEAPTTSFVIFPPNDAAMAALGAPGVQGSKVRIWAVALDPVTGQPEGDPELWMRGESDVLTNGYDANRRSLTITVNSRFARFLRPSEGARMNNGYHQLCRPGELGMQFMQSVARNIPWGSNTPTSSLSAAQQAAYARLYGSTYYGVTEA